MKNLAITFVAITLSFYSYAQVDPTPAPGYGGDPSVNPNRPGNKPRLNSDSSNRSGVDYGVTHPDGNSQNGDIGKNKEQKGNTQILDKKNEVNRQKMDKSSDKKSKTK